MSPAIDSQSDIEHEADAVAALRMVQGDTTAALLVRAIDRLITERDELREKLTAPVTDEEVTVWCDVYTVSRRHDSQYEAARRGIAAVLTARCEA